MFIFVAIVARTSHVKRRTRVGAFTVVRYTCHDEFCKKKNLKKKTIRCFTCQIYRHTHTHSKVYVPCVTKRFGIL